MSYKNLNLYLPYSCGYVVTLNKNGEPISGFYYHDQNLLDLIGKDEFKIKNYRYTKKFNPKTIKDEVTKAVLDLLDVGQGFYHPYTVKNCLILGFDLHDMWATRETKDFHYKYGSFLDD